MLYLIPIAVLVVVFFFLSKFMKGKVGGLHAQYQVALDEYNANEESFLSNYWDNENRFLWIKKNIPNETIIGLSGARETSSVGSKVKESILSSITNVNKFDMSNYYLVVTENNLHFLGFNGTDQQAFAHETLLFSNIKNADLRIDVATPLLSFDYEGKKAKFDLTGPVSGYPKFEVNESFTKNMTRTENDRNFNPYERKYSENSEDLGVNAYNLNLIIRSKIFKGFMLKMEKDLGLKFPATYDLYRY
jgi:hypothetical protein